MRRFVSARQAIACLFTFVALGAASASAGGYRGGDGRHREPAAGRLIQVTETSPFALQSACSNAPGVIVGAGTLSLDSEVEPWLAVNPTDERNLVAFWQQDRWSNGGARDNVAAVSFDGGRSWETVVVPGLTKCTDASSRDRASDAWVSFGPDGVVHEVSIVIDRDPLDSAAKFGFGPNGIAVSRSNDGGRTWTGPILVAEDTMDPGSLNDKPSITADPTDAGLVYVIWDHVEVDPEDEDSPSHSTVQFARSTDGGATWESPRTILDPGADNDALGGQILVGPHGRLFAFFNKIVQVNPDGTLNPLPQGFQLTVLRSDDKGVTWDSADGGTEIAVMLAGGAVTPDANTMIRDGAVLFDVAIDRRTGALYAVWQDFRFIGFEQVAFSQSLDGGRTWSSPIAVNATPRNRDKPYRQQALLPSVAVARDGTVGVTYYDFRNDDASGELADHWLVRCRRGCDRRDGWTDETRLTETSFDFALAPVSDGVFIGDYVGLAAAGNDFLALFPQAVSAEDPASLFFRRVEGGRDDHRLISKLGGRDDRDRRVGFRFR